MVDSRPPLPVPRTETRDLDDALPGLVWAYRFDAEGHAARLPGAEVAEALASDDGWVWLHFNLTDTRARTWIEEAAPLPEAGRELLLDVDDHLCLIAEHFEIFFAISFPYFNRGW